MENMESFTPLYAIAYAIMNSMENLCFGKEDYFHVLVFLYRLFYKRNRKHIFRAPIRYRNTRGSLGELEIAWRHSPYGLVFPLQFLGLPNFYSCFYDCMETRKNVLYFLISTLPTQYSTFIALFNTTITYIRSHICSTTLRANLVHKSNVVITPIKLTTETNIMFELPNPIINTTLYMQKLWKRKRCIRRVEACIGLPMRSLNWQDVITPIKTVYVFSFSFYSSLVKTFG